MSVQTFIGTLVVEYCRRSGCGVPFGMTSDLQQRRRNDHKIFYCPNGHSQYYNGRSEEEKLRNRLTYAQDALAAKEAALRRADYAHRATKGKVTKLKRRIENGVCPCCQRTFTNVARHMASQHPDFTKGEGETQ